MKKVILCFTVVLMQTFACASNSDEKKARFFLVQEPSESQFDHLRRLSENKAEKKYLTEKKIIELSNTEHITLDCKDLKNQDVFTLASLPHLQCLTLSNNPEITDLRPLLHSKSLRSLHLKSMAGLHFESLRDFLLGQPNLDLLTIGLSKLTHAELAILKSVFDDVVRIKHDGLLALSRSSMTELKDMKSSDQLIAFMERLRGLYTVAERRPWVSDLLWGKGPAN